MSRSGSYRRWVREAKIRRKQRISSRYWYVKCRGVLDKGKIHCSCWMCSAKTNKDGPPISELRRNKEIIAEELFVNED